ncbi:MAG TPA: hypothetical protein VFV94_21045 [Polyangiaceae bacterium]|nr:hypothetical protein [Polyangiaceae bacterium]
MTAEVFDVSRIDEDGLEVLDDEEVVPDSNDAPPASLLPPSLRPSSRAPHPPRPSVRPRPLAPDDVHIDTPLSYASNPAALLIAPPSAPVVAPQKTSGSGRTLLVLTAAAVVALLGGMLLGRSDPPSAAAQTSETPTHAAPAVTEATSDGRFSEALAHTAIDGAVTRATACRDANAPSGPVSVRLTFAHTGQVVGVDVRKPFAGTTAGDCFAASLRELRVPAFQGAIAVVDRTVDLPLP